MWCVCTDVDSDKKRRGVRCRIFPQQHIDAGPCKEGGDCLGRSNWFTTSSDAVWYRTSSTVGILWRKLTSFQYVTATEVNSAFYPTWDGIMSISFWLSNDDKLRWWIRFTDCLYRQACSSSRLAWSKVGSHLVLFCIHRANRVHCLQWLCRDMSTIHFVVVIMIIIIYIYIFIHRKW